MRHHALRALFLVALVLTAASLPARAHADDHVMSSPSCCPWGLLTQTLDGVVTDAWAVPWEENANPVHFQPLPDGGAVFDTGASGAPDPLERDRERHRSVGFG